MAGDTRRKDGTFEIRTRRNVAARERPAERYVAEREGLPPRKDATRKEAVINLRAPAPLRDLIDRAAAVEGKSRTEFMLESARQHAEDVLLDQRLFSLDEDRYQAFLKILDEPPQANAKLKALLAGKSSPWEK